MSNAQLIAKIEVKNLFGLYTYTLPESGSFKEAAILYGDNGLGKSTLLRLVFHLLSTADDRGHRTALFEGNFETLRVTLESGILLSAENSTKEHRKCLTLRILKDSAILAEWEYYGKKEDPRTQDMEDYVLQVIKGRVTMISGAKKKQRRDNIPRGNEAYLAVLKRHVPSLFILNAERRLDSDSVPDPSDEVELRRLMHFEDRKRLGELVIRAREIALSQALASAAKWVGRKAVIGANQGSQNVHSVYLDVLKKITKSKTEPEFEGGQTTGDLVKELERIEEQTSLHAQYEFATKLSTTEFREALLKAEGGDRLDLMGELIQPYVRGLASRLAAAQPVYEIIDRFVQTINSFLNDKALRFSLSGGFKILNRLGRELNSSELSSGEQQLILLFCCVLTARDSPSVFMIDEPEISLNVKWQRQLIQSLLAVTEGATIQFILASHSMELLAQHRNLVVGMVRQ